ncbi:ATP-binding cassette domain-containing protein, partial [Rhizobiaceae sp. 2RAB30]
MLLTIDSLQKSYGSLVVTDGVSLSVAEGEALGIIGPNGAGKTTLFALITGAIAPNGGTIALDGDDITRMPPQKRCLAGICRSHQVPHPFEKLTVAE